MSDTVSFECSEDVAIIRLDDGKANALSPPVLTAIGSALDQAEEAKLAVLLTGRPGRFSAGFDLNVMREGGPAAARAMVMDGARLALRIARFPAPVVIASTGHALAMGAVLLMAADSRIGAEGEFKIGFNEVAIGMTTPIFLAEMARARMPNTEFIRGTVQAEIYSPETAVSAGFYDRTAAPEQLFDRALEEAGRLAKLPRGAYVRTRAIVRGAALDHIEATLEQDLTSGFPDS
ncbi:MAG: crotonase/enoyl-CoA hydratase family protein [Deltaproteobacteria bacterium]|nr:crotonase/enoyl-CoA hydratase family protein [Deltaproteobacteria bacterium]MBW2391358.1 crotonase/enoyl-CoA hydratase family protein [Deltaproteobacteria bacterium]MBW2725719.1 crotonase/enoyl-CoA hydratase family protein [Deltaproteobacteria bacterium]